MRIPNQRKLWGSLFLTGSFLFAHAMQSQVAPRPPDAPEALQPPKDQVLLLHFKGKGKQIYSCQKAGGAYAWKLKAPDAQLFDEDGKPTGRHFAGPTWESTDGSRVVGKLVTSIPSPDSDSIPWLLLTMKSHEGSGIMNKVQSIQRLNTHGGIAPSSGCDAANESHKASVAYEADYYFYGTP